MKLCQSFILALGFTAFAASAQAQLVVRGKSDAALCYDYAVRGNMGSFSAIDTCSSGLSEFLSVNDKAATYVNRGILFMRKGDQDLAAKDFDSAISIKPGLTEAYVNYGASLIRQGKLDEALKSLNVALEDFSSGTRPDALYNRAIIFDRKENYKSAYHDLKAALAIRPDWDQALKLIDRYEVRKAG